MLAIDFTLFCSLDFWTIAFDFAHHSLIAEKWKKKKKNLLLWIEYLRRVRIFFFWGGGEIVNENERWIEYSKDKIIFLFGKEKNITFPEISIFEFFFLN